MNKNKIKQLLQENLIERKILVNLLREELSPHDKKALISSGIGVGGTLGVVGAGIGTLAYIMHKRCNKLREKLREAEKEMDECDNENCIARVKSKIDDLRFRISRNCVKFE